MKLDHAEAIAKLQKAITEGVESGTPTPFDMEKFRTGLKLGQEELCLRQERTADSVSEVASSSFHRSQKGTV